MNNHKGNTQPSIDQEEHEGSITPYTKRTLPYGYDGTAKNLFYVDTNGIQRSIVSIAHPISAALGGNVTLNPSENWIGLATTVIGSAPTLFAVVNTSAAGQSSIVIDTGSKWIGLVSTASIQGKVDILSIAAGNTNIGDVDIASIAGGDNNIGNVDIASIAGGDNNIGNVDVVTLPALVASTAAIGFSTVYNATGSSWIGLVSTASIQGKVEVTTLPSLVAGTAQIGFATVAGTVSNNVAGTTRTLEIKNIGICTASYATIFVPTAEFHITHLVLSSDATVKVNILSGATYLTGNASIGISLAPLGGWVESGSVDSPIYEGLAAGGAFVIASNTSVANIGGKVVYYEG